MRFCETSQMFHKIACFTLLMPQKLALNKLALTYHNDQSPEKLGKNYDFRAFSIAKFEDIWYKK